MKSTMMLYFVPISMAVGYILSSGTFDRILEWRIKIRELKLNTTLDQSLQHSDDPRHTEMIYLTLVSSPKIG